MDIIQTELHRHLDVSIRTTTLLELLQENGLEPTSTSLENFKKKLYINKPLSDLNSVLAQFSLFQKVLNKEENLERIAFEVIEDCYNEGTKQVELRFAPSFVCEFNSFSWQQALEAFDRGRKKALAKWPEMKVGFLLIAARDYGVDSVHQTVEFFLKNRKFLLGLDLAGNEVNFPCKLFEKAFEPARKANANITIHAGEAVGPENMWEAIELLGAKRIGHGISCVKDPKLVEHLREKQICLEMCPTSNWLTQAVLQLENHPIKRVLESGIPVTINTDDPGIFNVSLPDELKTCKNIIGCSDSQINQCLGFAAQFTFL